MAIPHKGQYLKPGDFGLAMKTENPVLSNQEIKNKVTQMKPIPNIIPNLYINIY